MRKIRNRLLITLVSFGVLLAAVAHAQTVSLGKLPAEPIGKSDPATPRNAGEPDVGDHAPQRSNLSGTRTSSQGALGWKSSSPTNRLTSADALRWAWVIWMAQYLNRLP